MSLKCPYCDRDLLSAGSGRGTPACHYADDHPTGKIYYRGDKDVRPVQVIVRFLVNPDVLDPRLFVQDILEQAQAGHEPIPEFEVLPQVWKYTGKETTRNIGGRPVAP